MIRELSLMKAQSLWVSSRLRLTRLPSKLSDISANVDEDNGRHKVRCRIKGTSLRTGVWRQMILAVVARLWHLARGIRSGMGGPMTRLSFHCRHRA
jgi:hypothetical protein